MSYLDKELYYAVCYDKVVQVKNLLANNASVTYQGYFGKTAIHEAVANGNVEILDLLIRNKADVNATKYDGETALHDAAAYGNVKVTDILIRNKADVNATGYAGETPLHKAVTNGNVEVADLLKKNKAGLNIIGDKQKAAANEDIEVTDLLISNTCDLNGPAILGDSPLHQAARKGDKDLVKSLVSRGANVSTVNNEGATPLHKAAEMGNVEIIDILIRNIADVNAPDNVGATPIHTAAIHGHVEVIDILIRNKADVNAIDNDGNLPLHQAVKHEEESMVEVLINLGADSSAKNNEGKTPYDLAEDGYVRNRNNTHTYKYRRMLDFLKDKSNIFSRTKDQSRVLSKKQALNAQSFSLTTTVYSEKTKEKDIQLPWLVDSAEFQRMLFHGTFLSYENRLSLGGPCKAGKSTLASVLIGEEIPFQWNSTDGLVIYFGRNGIDIQKKKMVPLMKGDRGHEVLAKVLRGKPDIYNRSDLITGERTTTHARRNTSKSQIDNKPSELLTKAMPLRHTVAIPSADELLTNVSMTQFELKHKSAEMSDKYASPVVDKMKTLDCRKLQLQSDVLDEVRNGKYRIEIAPSDLIDFGGQKSYDMTHQLFIQHRGSFLLMFDGRYGLHNQLREYPPGVTAASILKHWVDSILTYTTDTDDIMPMILFAATHRDMCGKDTSKMKESFSTDIKSMFSNHEKKNHIYLDNLYFINAVDKDDAEIQKMTDQIVMFAMRQSSWGQRRPMQWVPLDLQISNMRLRNINILTKEKLRLVNNLNEDLALNEHQLDDFLLVQHSLGKLMYYNFPGLDKFIIIHPPALVNILRSFVVDEHFWPADAELRSILQTMTDTGRIYKKDLLKLWEPPQFKQYMQNGAIKEFIIELLVHLDILIVPKAFTDVFLVPCMIKATKPDFNNLRNQRDTTICLQYALGHNSIPSALAYKIIGAAIIAWPLKVESKTPCLYHKAALLNVSEDDELRIWVEDNRVTIYMTNKKSLLFISPDVAASIQECLTKNIESALLFYYKSFGNTIKPTNVLDLYTVAVGIPCGNNVCFSPVQDVNQNDYWKCGKGKTHDTKYLRYWIFKKSQQMCALGCKGLSSDDLETKPSDKHLVRLGCQIGIKSFEEFFIHLGMTTRLWENTVDMYGGHSREGIMSMALSKWKESKLSNLEEPTLKDLSDALTAANLDKHCICQVFREETKLLDIADFKLQDTPSDDVLKELSNQIGNCALQLGIELGISFYEVEKSFVKFPKDLSGLVEDILKKWKATSKIKTTHSLMMALVRVDGGGVQYLHKLSK